MAKHPKTPLVTFNPAYLFILVAVLFFSYVNSFGGQFQFDDGEYIVENPIIKQGLNVVDLFTNLQTPDLQSRIVTFWTFALNHELGGLNVWGHHLFNWVIHAANSFLIFWMCQLIWKSPSLTTHRFYRFHPLLSLFTALIFAVHPIETQAVSYVSQRFASLATCFYLLSICFFISAGQKKSKGLFAISMLMAVVAMFTKQIAFTLPIMLFVAYQFFIKKEEERGASPNWKLMGAVVAGLCVIPAFFKFDFNTFWLRSLESHSHRGDVIYWWNYALTQFHVLLVYLKLLIVPVGLNLDYDFTASNTLFDPYVLTGICVVGCLIALAGFFYQRDKLISFGIIWFLVTMSVESSIIPIRHVIFEHRMYLPSIGFAFAVPTGIFYLLNDKKLFIGIMSVYVGVLSLLTYQRNIVWQTEINLWQDVITKSPQKPRGYLNLGKAYYEKGDYDNALQYLSAAERMDPADPKIHNNLGLTYKALNRFDQALASYSKAIEIEPTYAKAYNNRGLLYKALKQYENALKDYSDALKYSPGYAAAVGNRGVIYGVLNQHERAVKDFTLAMAYNPDYYQLYQNRGFSHLMLGKYDLAMTDLTQAIELNPKHAMSYLNRCQVNFQLQHFAQAYQDMKMAEALGLKVDPRLRAAVESKIHSK